MNVKQANSETGLSLYHALFITLILGMIVAIAIPIYLSLQPNPHNSANMQADVRATKQNVQIAVSRGVDVNSGSTSAEVGATVQNRNAQGGEVIAVLIQNDHEILVLGTSKNPATNFSETIRH